MKIVILCGGKGMRFREETEYKPKPMVGIGGLPIVWHIMKTYSTFGFNDFILCLGYKQNVIKEYFLNYEHMNNDFTINLRSHKTVTPHNIHNENWNVTLINTGLDTPKGTRIKMIEPYIKEERFMLTYGDGLGDINVKGLIDYHVQQEKMVTFTGVHPISRFATIETDKNDEITAWSEKKTLEGYINAGFFVLERKIFDYINEDCEFEEGPMEELAREKQIAMYKHEGFWHCMDTYRDYVFLEKLWAEGKAPWKLW